MLVICRLCRNLIPEEQAIKINEVELRDLIANGDNLSYYENELTHYTQICQDCYKEKNK